MSDTQPKCARCGWDHMPSDHPLPDEQTFPATPTSDTPRTDAEALKSRPPFTFVTRKFAEELERECNQLRKDLKDSQTAVRLIAEALGNISIGTSCSECGGEDQARVAKAFLEAMK